MFEYLGLWSVRSLTQVLLKTKSYKLVVGNYGNSNAKTTASGCDKCTVTALLHPTSKIFLFLDFTFTLRQSFF